MKRAAWASLALALIAVPVMFTGIYLVYYSYSEYQKLAVDPR